MLLFSGHPENFTLGAEEQYQSLSLERVGFFSNTEQSECIVVMMRVKKRDDTFIACTDM